MLKNLALASALCLFTSAAVAQSEVTRAVDVGEKLLFEVAWKDPGVDIDVWMKSPDGVIVGYPRKESNQLRILKDNLGQVTRDFIPLYELVLADYPVAGVYELSVHYFAGDPRDDEPVPVHVNVYGRLAIPIFHDTVYLSSGEEKAVLSLTVVVVGGERSIPEPAPRSLRNQFGTR